MVSYFFHFPASPTNHQYCSQILVCLVVFCNEKFMVLIYVYYAVIDHNMPREIMVLYGMIRIYLFTMI